MGGFNAFEDLNPDNVTSIREFSEAFFHKQNRRPKIALDMSNHIVQVSTESKSKSQGIAHRLLFRRLAAYLKIGIVPIAVFDGPLTDEKRRHNAVASIAQISTVRQFSPMICFAKTLCKTLGIAVIEAPAEAEALCSWLQRNKHADAVFSADADVLANGATCILRYVPPQSAAAAKSSNAEDRLIEVFHLSPSDAPQFALMALILGNDWADGVPRLGKATAIALSNPATKFAQRLVDLMQMDQYGQAQVAVQLKRLEWHDDFVNELQTNAHGWLSRKCHQPVPDSFPDLKLFAKLLQPSSSYNTLLVSVCRQPEKYTSGPLLPDSKDRIERLVCLWMQPCPGFTSSNYNHLDPEECSPKLLKFTLASLLVANSLISSEDRKEIKFKEVHKGSDVEVVEGMNVPPFNSSFLVGAQVAKFIFDMNKTAVIQPKAPRQSNSRKAVLQRKAVRENSKITQFFQPRKTKSIQTAKTPMKATRHCQSTSDLYKVREQICPLTFDSPDSEGDTDIDEPDADVCVMQMKQTTANYC